MALRGTQRWIRDVEAVRLQSRGEDVARLRNGGVYMITGGLGNIGLVLATHLAKKAQAKMVLIGRSAFPARADWDHWLAAHGDDNPISASIRKLQACEDAGG